MIYGTVAKCGGNVKGSGPVGCKMYGLGVRDSWLSSIIADKFSTFTKQKQTENKNGETSECRIDKSRGLC